MSLHRPSFRQALALLVSAAALAAIAIVWTRVVSTISSGSPPASTVQATSIIWRDRVFVSVPELSRWLRSRGATYKDWSRNHPAARDRLEHLMRPPPPPQSTTVEVSPAPVAAGPSASSTSSPGFPFESVVVTLLILLAVACAAAASLPEAVLYRFPRLTRTIAPRRDLFLAGAAAILIAVLAAVVLS